MVVAFIFLGLVLVIVVATNPRWVWLGASQWNNTRFNMSVYGGFWDNCDKTPCWKPQRLSVYLICARALMFLSATFTFLLLFVMLCSFRRIFRRISNLDLIFSIMAYVSGLSVFLSVLLFSLQVLEIFHKEGRPVHLMVHFYLAVFDILIFLAAGSLSLYSHKFTWHGACLTPAPRTLPSPILSAETSKESIFGSSRTASLMTERQA
ncbi:transmembrane protein 225B isoform X2 [Ornithorhynchus anatinus]|nr:transmembrane protein 225B isoform X2 [Ornithorhynchus anatinus]